MQPTKRETMTTMTPLEGFTKLIGSLNGRDKVNKLVQMMAKILYHVSSQNQADKMTITKYKNLAAGIGNARKVDRLLKSTVEVQKIMNALNSSKGDSFNTALTAFSAFCMA